MSKIKRFEEIKAWKSAKQLVMNIYESSGKGDFAKDWSLKDQIRRAAISTISNIAEGYARNTDKECAVPEYRFRFHSRGSKPALYRPGFGVYI